LTGRSGGIYRFKDGKITEELSGMDLIGGRPSHDIPPRVTAVDGAEYVLQMRFGYYTTLAGLTRSDAGNVHVDKAETGWRVTWDGYGKLQGSEDMGIWHDLSVTPLELQAGSDFPPQFFRVYYP
jgi:hypothetical protein